MTPTQALTQALILGLTASDEHKADLAIHLALVIVNRNNLTKEQVNACKAMANQIAEKETQ
jgi:hypothetical protein